MRAAVLCVLAFAGATCALQIPSLPSPQSMVGAGSSILNNIPQINPAGDSSSSSSSSEENNTPQIATELATRLAQDVMQGAEGFGSLALLPLKVGTSMFNTIADDIKDFMSNVPNMGNVATDSNVPALVIDLTKSVVRDVEHLARDAGALLLEPAKFKVRLVETIARDVAQWLKKIQGEASQQHNRPPMEPPRPTPPKGHRPTRPHRPRPTRPHRPSSSRPRPTTPGLPTPPRPRPTPSLPPTSSRPRPTTTERPSSPRPSSTTSEGTRPTTSQGSSSSRPTATTSAVSRPTTSQGPSSSRPTATTQRGTSPTSSAPTTSSQPRPTTSATTTSSQPSSTTSAPTTSSQTSSTTSAPPSTQQTSTIQDSSDEGSSGLDGSLKLGRALSVSGSIHSDIPNRMSDLLGGK